MMTKITGASNLEENNLEERWIAFSSSPRLQVALIIDCSADLPGVWEQIWARAVEIHRRLPSGAECKAYFLGNRGPFSMPQVVEGVAELWRANAGRPRLLGPLFAGVEKETIVIVLAAGRILDLECWAANPIVKRTHFLRFGDPAVASDPWHETTDFDQMISYLQRSVTGITLSGTGLMPFEWSNTGYTWNETALEAKALKSYETRVGLLIPRGKALQLRGQMENGGSEPLQYTEVRRSAVQRSAWSALSGADAALLRDLVDKGSCQCPYDQAHSHSRSEIRCQQANKSRGRLLFEGIAAAERAKTNLRAFVILRIENGACQWLLHESNVLRIGPATVAVATWKADRATRAAVFRFHGGHWVKQDQEVWEQFCQFGEGYAILP